MNAQVDETVSNLAKELNNTIKKIKLRKASVQDRITPDMIKYL